MNDKFKCGFRLVGGGFKARNSCANWLSARVTINVSRIKWAINQFNPFESPEDWIFPAMLQKALGSLYILRTIFREDVAE